MTTGTWNVALGANSLGRVTTGNDNIAIGAIVAGQYTTASGNVAIGTAADYNNGTGNENVVIGFRAGWPGWTGESYDQDNRVIIGAYAGQSLTVGNTIFIGHNAGYKNTDGVYSVLIGNDVAFNNTSAKNSVMIGYQAGYNSESDNNVFIGYKAGYNETGSNRLYIANSDTSNPLIYGEFDNRKVKINDYLIVGDKIGIGTDSPEVKLRNTGMSMFGSADLVLASNENLIYGNVSSTSAGNLLLLQNASTDKFKVDPSGNVEAAGNIKADNYLQVGANGDGAPPAGDCDDDSERGRMYIDTTNNRLYICNGATRGWDYVVLTD